MTATHGYHKYIGARARTANKNCEPEHLNPEQSLNQFDCRVLEELQNGQISRPELRDILGCTDSMLSHAILKLSRIEHVMIYEDGKELGVWE